MTNFQPFTANAEDPFIASYPAMELLATNDFGLQNLPFSSSDGVQAKASAKPLSTKEPKKRQRTPETVPQGNAPGLSQLASLLQELIAQIAQNRQEDNKRWQKMCQMLQYLKGQSESPSSELLQASKERKQELRIVAKAFHDLLVQLEQERS
ncbi:hypothetical protein DM02DRAFT_663217 [Periconia macrospinosa]|uniref:Uncharacterized protein n=1 Tax=Periconia macrospinosa TaxID=97972 RepID=A0A2V1D291_9PLEO|nr:hypothetical protein DM02DRAFT_663217 [Periconia macrospinosa]